MSDQSKDKVYLVTGVRIATGEDGILIAGMLCESPFTNDEQPSPLPVHPVGNFAFTRQQAAFFRNSLNEFLKDKE